MAGIVGSGTPDLPKMDPTSGCTDLAKVIRAGSAAVMAHAAVMAYAGPVAPAPAGS